MYEGKRNNRKWTIEEKNQIVLLYLDGHMSGAQIVKEFHLPQQRMLYKWTEQYRKFGTTVDNRGRGTKNEIPNKGSVSLFFYKHYLIYL